MKIFLRLLKMFRTLGPGFSLIIYRYFFYYSHNMYCLY